MNLGLETRDSCSSQTMQLWSKKDSSFRASSATEMGPHALSFSFLLAGSEPNSDTATLNPKNDGFSMVFPSVSPHFSIEIALVWAQLVRCPADLDRSPFK